MFLANISDPEVQSYRVKGLSLSSYKFVVKAYTSAGEDAGSTVAIKVEMDSKKWWNSFKYSVIVLWLIW